MSYVREVINRKNTYIDKHLCLGNCYFLRCCWSRLAGSAESYNNYYWVRSKIKMYNYRTYTLFRRTVYRRAHLRIQCILFFIADLHMTSEIRCALKKSRFYKFMNPGCMLQSFSCPSSWFCFLLWCQMTKCY